MDYCRRCAVWRPKEEVTFGGETLLDKRQSAIRHLIACHPNRTEELMGYFADLLLISNEYIDSALRDHNAEGGFNLANVVKDQAKRYMETAKIECAQRFGNEDK